MREGYGSRRVCLSVCLSVYPSVPALAASASVETSKQRYSRVSLRLFLETSEIQARAYTALVRACAVYTARLLVYHCVALAVQCETTHGVYEFRRGFCTSVLSLSRVCVCVYLAVPALAASASVETSKQRYSRVSLRLFLDFDSWIF